MPESIDDKGLYSYLVAASSDEIKTVSIDNIEVQVRRSYQNDSLSYPLLTFWKESPSDTNETIRIINLASALFFDTYVRDALLGGIAEWNMRVKTGNFLDNDDEGDLENGDLYIRSRIVSYI